MRHYALIALLALAACGPTAQQVVLKSALTGLNATRDGFVAWDAARQQQIVAGAADLADGTNKLRAYRQARERVVLAFEIGYKLVAVAALDLTETNLGAALHAAGEIYDSVRKLTGGAVAGGP